MGNLPRLDILYSAEVIEQLRRLQEKETLNKDDCKPWAMVASFVNPHDIALFGAYTRMYPLFNFEIDSSGIHWGRYFLYGRMI